MRTISPNSVPSMMTAPMSASPSKQAPDGLDSVYYPYFTAAERGWRSERPCPSDLRPTSKQAAGTPARATRRPRGEPRRLLLDAARDLFARQDYRSTTTREIAEAAGVTEHLLFRHFGSKAALFREALVLPFTSFVDDFGRTWQAVVPEETDEDELASQFVGQLYDVFVEHQGLVLTLLASEALSEEEMAEAGIADIRRALAVLGRDQRRGHGHSGDAVEPPGSGGLLDGRDDRRHGCVAFDLLRNQAAFESGDRRGAHPGDPPRLPASAGLTVMWGDAALGKVGAVVTPP